MIHGTSVSPTLGIFHLGQSPRLENLWNVMMSNYIIVTKLYRKMQHVQESSLAQGNAEMLQHPNIFGLRCWKDVWSTTLAHGFTTWSIWLNLMILHQSPIPINLEGFARIAPITWCHYPKSPRQALFDIIDFHSSGNGLGQNFSWDICHQLSTLHPERPTCCVWGQVRCAGRSGCHNIGSLEIAWKKEALNIIGSLGDFLAPNVPLHCEQTDTNMLNMRVQAGRPQSGFLIMGIQKLSSYYHIIPWRSCVAPIAKTLNSKLKPYRHM